MRKHFRPVLLLTLLALTLLLMTSCSFSEIMENPFFAQGNGSIENNPPADNKDTPDEHTHAWGVWTADAATPSQHMRTCTGCEAVERAEHTPAEDLGTSPTCGTPGLTNGSHCSICEQVLVAQEPLPATGKHTPVPCDLVLPTFTVGGCLSGEKCTTCEQVISGEHILPAYSATCGTYAYTSLATHENGAQLQALYTAVYNSCVAFHTSTTVNATQNRDGDWIAFTVPYDADISTDDAFLVLHAVRSDCPIFYWIGNKVSAINSALSVHTDAPYALASARTGYNNLVYTGISEIGHKTGDAYTLSFYLHDLVVNTLTYAYEADGTTPSEELWAHNILGYFLYDTGVCETYSEVYQLMLNYWGIENILVTGTADGGGHAWNMVRMANGDWYWYDLTWDDQPTRAFGRIYNFFCQSNDAFGMERRTVDTSTYPLPAAATRAYTPAIPAAGSTLRAGTFSYLVVGYGQVELTRASGFGVVSVPKSITDTATGTVYDVISIGCIVDNTLTPVFTAGVTGVIIPDSVWNIRGGAFQTAGLTSVKVDENNPYLLSEGDVAIYRRDPVSLVCYLPTATAKTLTLRADTVAIESWAIVNGSVVTVNLPAALRRIDANAFYGTSSDLTLRYAGTIEDYLAVQVDTDTLPACRILCSDGTLQD